jgi:putative membrane protein
MMGGYHMMSNMGGGMLMIALFWVVVIALIFWGMITMDRIQRGLAAQDSQELLKRRYARGEISREEFEQIRAALR